jgi:transcription-repair coupling factor (superfamily II helicase)
VQLLSDTAVPIWLKPLNNWERFDDIKQKLYKGKTQIAGLSAHSKSHIVASLIYPLSTSCLFVTCNEFSAKNICEDLEFYFPDKVLHLPARELFFYQAAAQSNEITAKRLKALTALAANKDVIVVASLEAVLTLQSSLKCFIESIFEVTAGDELPLSSFAEKLVSLGYERVDAVEGAGQFSIRGGIVDFFPPVSDKPCRIEMFDDIVDSIREFDPISQRSTDKLKKTEISPAHELILTQEVKDRAIENITCAFEKAKRNFKASNGKDALKRLENKTEALLDALSEGSNSAHMESYIYFFYPNKISAVDYLPVKTLIVIDEPSKLEECSKVFCEGFSEHFKDLLEQGEVFPEQSNTILDYDDILSKVKAKNQLILRDVPSSPDSGEQIMLLSRSVPSWQGNLNIFLDEITALKAQNYYITAVLSTKKLSQTFASLLENAGINTVLKEIHTGDYFPGQICAITGNLSRGFEYPDIRFMLITEKDIYGTGKKGSRARKASRKPGVLTDFKVGDYVVHENHGIGKYIGLETLMVEGRKRDYLNIKYAGTDRLYVPTDQLDLIQPYALVDDVAPKLSKLGGVEWQKTKARVNESVKKLAIDLLQLYAARQSIKGHRFAQDTDWQRQFEVSFPYEETSDQLQAAEDIKRDMESGKVMDRLLCGDVGYGKTEVAIRAAFKACMDNKQVAVLAPTTILAQQHYNTFVKRFEDFPFKIEVLSRFKTASEQKAVVRALKEGSVDVIIGTHRLLGKDIRFKDLGLLIIDEEQRFGVSHKEMIKDIKKNVDVLTLTATPIPRTLHMSLSGIRDISVIESPPEGRFPVQTYVVENDEPLIRDCIYKEIARGGQVYFVYNRVKSMDFMVERLRALVPGVRIAVAHGQMGENALEEVMMGFYKNDYDLLLCSAIIENGLDIPNVNTLIVYDCDHFGLSQLYQLRGRVGRSNRKAYAYFVYRKDKALTEQATLRLRTIKEFTEFGAGFKIAMRDMEIRGAGNIMGGEQHGHMVAVGYDMYYRLLKNAVDELKGELPQRVETQIDIKADAHISDEYIFEQGQRIGIYKRIAAIECEEDKHNVEEELEDRFGDPPLAARNLIDIAFVKALGIKLGILEITHHERAVRIKFSDGNVDKRKIMTLINENRSSLDYISSSPVVLSLKLKDSQPVTALHRTKELMVKMHRIFSVEYVKN